MHLSRHMICVLIFTFASLAGCGQTGPLYLPDSRREQLPPQTDEAASGTQAESEDDQRKKRPATDDVPATDTQSPVSPPDPDRPAQTPPQPQNR